MNMKKPFLARPEDMTPGMGLGIEGLTAPSSAPVGEAFSPEPVQMQVLRKLRQQGSEDRDAALQKQKSFEVTPEDVQASGDTASLRSFIASLGGAAAQMGSVGGQVADASSGTKLAESLNANDAQALKTRQGAAQEARIQAQQGAETVLSSGRAINEETMQPSRLQAAQAQAQSAQTDANLGTATYQNKVDKSGLDLDSARIGLDSAKVGLEGAKVGVANARTAGELARVNLGDAKDLANPASPVSAYYRQVIAEMGGPTFSDKVPASQLEKFAGLIEKKYSADMAAQAKAAATKAEAAKVSNKPLPAETAQKVGFIDSVNNYVGKMQGVLEKKGDRYSIIPGKEAEYERYMNAAAESYGRLQSGGAISEGEETRFKSRFRKFFDSPTEQSARLTELTEELAPRRALFMNGHNDPTGQGAVTQSKASSNTPATVIQNGVTYTLNPTTGEYE